MDWYEEVFRATVVLVAASVAVIVPGFAGLGGSPVLVGAGLVLAGLLYAVREQFEAAPHLFGHDLGRYGRVLWVSALVATAVFLVGLEATAGELRALGGLVGLAGMVNYFLRPVYRALVGIGRTLFAT